MARQKKPADAVQFTRESAERVARVVRRAELTPPAASPLSFRPAAVSSLPVFELTSFTGVWSKGMVKLFVKGETPNTVTYGVYNYFATVGTASTSVSTMAAIARVPNTTTNINWVLIAAECNP
jgi:hypothetical protein